MIRTLMWVVAFVVMLTPFAAAVAGTVSILIHPRDPPETRGEWVLWACRGAAYVVGVGLATILGLYAVLGQAKWSAFVAVIIGFALVGLRMRHEHHGTRGGQNRVT